MVYEKLTSWKVKTTLAGYTCERTMWKVLYPTTSTAQLAIYFDCTAQTIRNRIKRHGLPLRPRGGDTSKHRIYQPYLSKLTREKIKHLRDLGWSQQEVANRLQVSINSVKRYQGKENKRERGKALPTRKYSTDYLHKRERIRLY